jgi:hypothetical protein
VVSSDQVPIELLVKDQPVGEVSPDSKEPLDTRLEVVGASSRKKNPDGIALA